MATDFVFGGVPCDQLPATGFDPVGMWWLQTSSLAVFLAINYYAQLIFIPEGFQLVAGDKRSAITGVLCIESHPERMSAQFRLASRWDAEIGCRLPVVFASLDHRLPALIPSGCGGYGLRLRWCSLGSTDFHPSGMEWLPKVLRWRSQTTPVNN